MQKTVLEMLLWWQHSNHMSHTPGAFLPQPCLSLQGLTECVQFLISSCVLSRVILSLLLRDLSFHVACVDSIVLYLCLEITENNRVV